LADFVLEKSAQNVNTVRRGGRGGLRPAGKMIVTKVKPSSVRIAHATVLFADLRGYTGMAERLPPARVLSLLDEFLRVLSSAVSRYQGTVFHMAGDGMMAGFGVAGEGGDGARAALSAGNAMLEDFAPIAIRWRSKHAVEAGVGVGVHLGEVAVGVLGAPRQRRTTLVGDTVNVAARLCSRARAGEVLFSCTVAAAIDTDTAAPAVPVGAVPFLQLPQFELRGRRSPIDIWCIPAVERLAL
jgi:adenylate cyclase